MGSAVALIPKPIGHETHHNADAVGGQSGSGLRKIDNYVIGIHSREAHDLADGIPAPVA
jgi:hypothetical protein